MTGTWRITQYIAETDRTSEYFGYTFSFNSNGSVAASTGTSTVNGTWLSYEAADGIALEFEFEAEEPFVDMQLDWQVKTFDSMAIHLENVDDIDNSTSTLTFGR